MSSCSGPVSELLAKLSNSGSVKIKNAEHVERMLQRIVADGPEQLQIISDFDRTLSKGYQNGAMCPPSTGVLRTSPMMPDSFREEVMGLYNHYYPIETNHDMTNEEKTPFMLEWYGKSRAAQMATGVISQNFLQDLVHQSKSCPFRDNLAVTLQLANQASIPVIVFSAGSGNIIQIKLEQLHVDLAHVRIVSNFMNFDQKTGLLTGWKEPTIHPFNKNESVLGEHQSFMNVEHRGNVILIGDALSDLDMAKGMHNLQAELKIGFLNDRVEQLLPVFMDNFDIVLVEEESMNLINLVLRTALSLPLSI